MGGSPGDRTSLWKHCLCVLSEVETERDSEVRLGLLGEDRLGWVVKSLQAPEGEGRTEEDAEEAELRVPCLEPRG